MQLELYLCIRYVYLFNDVFPRHVRVARHCPSLDDAVPMDVHLDEATFRVEGYMGHKGQVIHTYIHIFLFIIHDIYIYMPYPISKRSQFCSTSTGLLLNRHVLI